MSPALRLTPPLSRPVVRGGPRSAVLGCLVHQRLCCTAGGGHHCFLASGHDGPHVCVCWYVWASESCDAPDAPAQEEGS